MLICRTRDVPQHSCSKYDQIWTWLVPRDVQEGPGPLISKIFLRACTCESTYHLGTEEKEEAGNFWNKRLFQQHRGQGTTGTQVIEAIEFKIEYFLLLQHVPSQYKLCDLKLGQVDAFPPAPLPSQQVKSDKFILKFNFYSMNHCCLLVLQGHCPLVNVNIGQLTCLSRQI